MGDGHEPAGTTSAAPAIDISSRVATILRLDPTHNAVHYDGRWESWGQMLARVEHIDHLLTAAGIGAGSKVGVVTRNRPPHIAAIEALLSTQRCLVPVSSISADTVVCDEVERLDLAALIALDEDWGREGLVERCTKTGTLGIVMSGGPDGAVDLVEGLTTTSGTHEMVDGVAILMPTSGTTGLPKRIRYTYDHVNGALGRIAGYAAATARSLGGPPELRNGVVLASLALAHISGLWAVLQAMAEGRCIVLLDRFEPHAWADLVELHGAKTSPLPPTTVRMVMDAGVEPSKLRSLISVNCGTAPIDPSLAEAFTDRYGVPVLVSYGATEFPGGTVGWTLADHKEFGGTKRGSVGRARPGIELRIVDAESGAVLPFGETGIVAIRSPQATVASTDGWVTTMDIGHMDADGFLWIVGRADDAINRGGFKIVPQVVETVLREHPAVAEAGVVGIPDERLGQVPVAVVRIVAPVTGEELREFVRSRLASYQVPVEIRILDTIPRTESHKVAKAEIRRLFALDRPS